MEECDEGRLHPLQFATRMAVMAFVKATCSRSGSAAKCRNIGLIEQGRCCTGSSVTCSAWAT